MRILPLSVFWRILFRPRAIETGLGVPSRAFHHTFEDTDAKKASRKTVLPGKYSLLATKAQKPYSGVFSSTFEDQSASWRSTGGRSSLVLRRFQHEYCLLVLSR